MVEKSDNTRGEIIFAVTEPAGVAPVVGTNLIVYLPGMCSLYTSGRLAKVKGNL